MRQAAAPGLLPPACAAAAGQARPIVQRRPSGPTPVRAPAPRVARVWRALVADSAAGVQPFPRSAGQGQGERPCARAGRLCAPGVPSTGSGSLLPASLRRAPAQPHGRARGSCHPPPHVPGPSPFRTAETFPRRLAPGPCALKVSVAPRVSRTFQCARPLLFPGLQDVAPTAPEQSLPRAGCPSPFRAGWSGATPCAAPHRPWGIRAFAGAKSPAESRPKREQRSLRELARRASSARTASGARAQRRFESAATCGERRGRGRGRARAVLAAALASVSRMPCQTRCLSLSLWRRALHSRPLTSWRRCQGLCHSCPPNCALQRGALASDSRRSCTNRLRQRGFGALSPTGAQPVPHPGRLHSAPAPRRRELPAAAG